TGNKLPWRAPAEPVQAPAAVVEEAIAATPKQSAQAVIDEYTAVLKGETPKTATPAQVTQGLQDLGPAVKTPEGVAQVVGEAAEPLFKTQVSPETTKQ